MAALINLCSRFPHTEINPSIIERAFVPRINRRREGEKHQTRTMKQELAATIAGLG